MSEIFLQLTITAIMLAASYFEKPATKVVLLPQADASASAVVVKNTQYEQILNAPYQRVTVQEGKPFVVDFMAAPDVQKKYPQLYEAMPKRPNKYVLNFMPGGTTLTAESLEQVSKIIEDAQNRSSADMVVTGHTDSTGALLANDALSLKRAGVVAQLLKDKGAVADRIEAVGRGKRELLVPTADEVDEPQNRRVEVVVR
jgi:OmpA-OmpF porin, OOP family